LYNGNIVCGGENNIRLFNNEFKEIGNKQVSGSPRTGLLVGNSIYFGLDDDYVVVFNESLD
jgi:hypothetical protein